MLTADQLDVLPENVLRLYRDFEDSVIADIARRLLKLDMTATAAWQAQLLIESGALYQDVLRKLSQLTGRSEGELRRLFRNAGVRSLRFDDKLYRAAGLEPLPLNLSPQMIEVLRVGIRRTAALMRNLTATTATQAQGSFVAAADRAFLQVSSGTFSYDQAIRAAINRVGESGLTVVYPSGRRDKLDVAMRRAVLTGVGRTAGAVQLARADEMGQDLVQTSAHIGARPTHEPWQGRIFSRSGTHPRYPHFETETGYGQVDGLQGINCRHSFFPFFEGISQNAYDEATRQQFARESGAYNGRTYSAYEIGQLQRRFERKIREWKRRAVAIDAAGLDAAHETAKVRFWQARMRDFIRQTGRRREYVREKV
jgi:hypothetical protein